MLFTTFGQNVYGLFNVSTTCTINFFMLDTTFLLTPEILLRVEASTQGAKGQFKPENLNLLFGNYSVCLSFGITDLFPFYLFHFAYSIC